MQDQIIISNKTLFSTYAIIRTIVIVALIVLLTTSYILYKDAFAFELLTGLFLSLMLTILILDSVQKPSFLELAIENANVVIKQYQPDNRYLFFFRSSSVNTTELHAGDRLGCEFIRSNISLLNQIEFQIIKQDKGVFKTPKINAAWINDAKLAQVNEVLKYQNGREV